MKTPAANSTERFSDCVEHYARYRPTYRAAVLEVLREKTGLTPAWTIADVGSGTGISAELFLRNGNMVYGVEPNQPMREAAERLLASYPRFHSIAATAEATTLPDASVDCMVAAQAFHWFDVPKVRAEFIRILRPKCWAVLLWNTRRLDATPFLRAFEELLIEYGTDYQRVRHDRIDDGAIKNFFGQRRFRTHSMENRQELALEGLRGRLLSSSYVPAAGAGRHNAMLEALARLFDDHQSSGRACLEYDTQLFYGQLT
jgi:ubiquinone/menaquinone biosynthesis C-methylase UbiE